MELARAWLEVESPALPAEVADVLSSHPSFSSPLSWTAEPEVRLPFDDFRGGESRRRVRAVGNARKKRKGCLLRRRQR